MIGQLVIGDWAIGQLGNWVLVIGQLGALRCPLGRYTRVEEVVMRRKDGINAKALKALDFIIQYKMENDGNSPTMREIAAGIGVQSVSYVDYLLKDLAAYGKIERVKRRNGSIRVTGGKWTVRAEQKTANSERPLRAGSGMRATQNVQRLQSQQSGVMEFLKGLFGIGWVKGS